MPIGNLMPRKCKVCGKTVMVMVGDVLDGSELFGFTCDKCKLKKVGDWLKKK